MLLSRKATICSPVQIRASMDKPEIEAPYCKMQSSRSLITTALKRARGARCIRKIKGATRREGCMAKNWRGGTAFESRDSGKAINSGFPRWLWIFRVEAKQPSSLRGFRICSGASAPTHPRLTTPPPHPASGRLSPRITYQVLNAPSVRINRRKPHLSTRAAQSVADSTFGPYSYKHVKSK